MIGAWGPWCPLPDVAAARPQLPVGSVNTAEVAVAAVGDLALRRRRQGDLDIGVIAAMLLGGMLAARSPPGPSPIPLAPMGVAVGALSLLTNARELSSSGELGPGRWLAYRAGRPPWWRSPPSAPASAVTQPATAWRPDPPAGIRPSRRRCGRYGARHGVAEVEVPVVLGFTPPSVVIPDEDHPGFFRAGVGAGRIRTRPSRRHRCAAADLSAPGAVAPDLLDDGVDTVDLSGFADLRATLAHVPRRRACIDDADAAVIRSTSTAPRCRCCRGRRSPSCTSRTGPDHAQRRPTGGRWSGPAVGMNGHGIATSVPPTRTSSARRSPR